MGVLVLAGVAGMTATVWKFIDLVKLVTARMWVPAITQVLVWLAGISVAVLYASSDFGSTVDIGTGQTLDTVNGATLVLVGIALGSIASAAVDFKKARDNNDSAVVPPLGGPPKA